MPDDPDFDESVHDALEADVVAMRSSGASNSTSTPSTLARSPAFFEALCLLCRHAAPGEVVRAAAKANNEEEDVEEEEENREEVDGDGDDLEPPRSQRLLLSALAAARALRGAAPRGYEARVLQESAKQSPSALGDELAQALASALLVKKEEEEEGEEEEGEEEEDNKGGEERRRRRRVPSPSSPLQLQAFFFGLALEETETPSAPTLASTFAFPVAASASADLLSGGTGKALWPSSRALLSLLLSEESELVRGCRVTELGCGVGLVGAALSLGGGWWLRRRSAKKKKKTERERNDDNDDENESGIPSFSFAPLSLRLTDGDSDSVSNARRTLEANKIEETKALSVSRLDWFEEEKSKKDDDDDNGDEEKKQLPTLIVGSDIMYDPDSAPALARVLASLLEESPDPKGALLAGVVRSEETVAAFERAFSEVGLFLESSSEEGPPTRLRGSPKGGCGGSLPLKVRAWHSGDEGVKVRWWWLEKRD